MWYIYCQKYKQNHRIVASTSTRDTVIKIVHYSQKGIQGHHNNHRGRPPRARGRLCCSQACIVCSQASLFCSRARASCSGVLRSPPSFLATCWFLIRSAFFISFFICCCFVYSLDVWSCILSDSACTSCARRLNCDVSLGSIFSDKVFLWCKRYATMVDNSETIIKLFI